MKKELERQISSLIVYMHGDQYTELSATNQGLLMLKLERMRDLFNTLERIEDSFENKIIKKDARLITHSEERASELIKSAGILPFDLVVVDVDDYDMLANVPKCDDVVIDHEWVEQYFEMKRSEAEKELISLCMI